MTTHISTAVALILREISSDPQSWCWKIHFETKK